MLRASDEDERDENREVGRRERVEDELGQESRARGVAERDAPASEQGGEDTRAEPRMPKRMSRGVVPERL